MKPNELAVDFFSVSNAWRREYAGAHAGILALRDVANPAESTELEQVKRQLEEELRRIHAGKDRAGLRADPALRAYEQHYRRFGKTYHVQLQLESIVLKGKPIPSGAALVEAMFMAEIEGRLLTAGHDLAAVRGKLQIDVANGSESYVLMRGTPQSPKLGDMMICDEDGIISSIVYGPDQRTQIQPGTSTAVFTVYAPSGIPEEDIKVQLERIREYAQMIAPAAQTLLLQVYPIE